MSPAVVRAPLAKGFTLIEVMIVTAIIAILASIALPSYRDYVIRGSLPDATANLSGLRTRMEQYYLDNRTYANGTACGVTMPVVDTVKDLFTYTCTLVSATAYTLTATGRTNRSSTGFTFTIDQTGTQQTTALPATWAAVTTVPVNRWVQRKGG